MKAHSVRPRKRERIGLSIIFVLTSLLVLCHGIGYGQGWNDINISPLPDAAFALVEKGGKGEIIRHAPHHDLTGEIDEEQLIFVLGTLEQETWLDPSREDAAKEHLRMHYDALRPRLTANGIPAPLDINSAPLTQLVTLPHIGPATAVRILTFRQENGPFLAIDDIKKVKGIGQATYDAIRHYITVR